MIDPIYGRTAALTNYAIAGSTPVEKQQGSPVVQDQVDLHTVAKPKSGFKEKLGSITRAVFGLKGRAYAATTGIGSLGLGLLTGLTLGPVGAACGAIAGFIGGIGAGSLLTTPMSWFRGNEEQLKELEQNKVPPGSDLNMNPEIKKSTYLQPEVQRKIDRTTDSEVFGGNKVTLLNDGLTSFPERYKMMENAKHSINLQSLIFHSDETGWKTAKLLAKKAKEGVKCRVIYDWASSIDSDSKIFKFMKDAGVEVVAFNTPLDFKWHGNKMKKAFTGIGKHEPGYWKGVAKDVFNRLKEHNPLNLLELNKRWHEKILTVDGQEAIVGGLNIGSEYAYAGTGVRDTSEMANTLSAMSFHDTDMKVAGPIVNKVNESFAENWKLATGESCDAILTENPPAKVQGDTETRFIKHMPHEKKGPEC